MTDPAPTDRPRFATGGIIDGPRDPGDDRIPVLLTGGCGPFLAERPPLSTDDVRYLLGSVNNALLNGSYMTNANIAFETLCDHLGHDREALPFDLERAREVFVRRFDIDADALRRARAARDEEKTR